MSLTRDQVQALRGMSTEATRNFHLNRIADALEDISSKLTPLRDLDPGPAPLDEDQTNPLRD